MNRIKGVLAVISGFSGAGKGTLMNELLKRYDYSLSISATTRKPRTGEVDGKNYYFIEEEEFEGMIRDNQLIEHTRYVGNYYGTPKKYVEQQLSMGKHVLLEIETKGAVQVKSLYQDAILIFITPPSITELKRRLVGRGTETDELVNKRIRTAKEESNYLQHYDYIIINDVIENSVEQIHQIIQCEAFRVNRLNEFIETIKKELETF